MKPLFRIVAEGKDITDLIADRLIRLTVTDKAGFESDTACIVLDDRDNRLELPRKGAELDIHMGTDKTGLTYMGLFTVDTTCVSGPPETLTLSAKAAEMRGSLKEKRTASFEQIRMGDLVATIAARHRLTPKVDPFLSEVQRNHIIQNNESDLHLLTRLAREIDAVAKAAGGCLIFVPKGKAKSVTGKELTPVEIRRADLSSWRFTFPDRAQYKSVVATYRDADVAKDVDIKVGDGEPILKLPKHYPNAQEAKEAAQGRFDKMGQEKATGSLSLAVGNPNLMAECPVTLPDMRPEVAGVGWVVGCVVHRLGGGYTIITDVVSAN